MASSDSNNEGTPPIVVGQSPTNHIDIVQELFTAFEEMVESGEIDLE